MNLSHVHLLLAFCCVTSGCSQLVLRTGKDVHHLFQEGVTRDEIRQQLGRPTSQGWWEVPKLGSTIYAWAPSKPVVGWEQYRYRGYVQHPHTVTLAEMSVGMTYGLGEFCVFPWAVGHACRELRVQHSLRVYYTPEDSVGFVTYQRSDELDEQAWVLEPGFSSAWRVR